MAANPVINTLFGGVSKNPLTNIIKIRNASTKLAVKDYIYRSQDLYSKIDKSGENLDIKHTGALYLQGVTDLFQEMVVQVTAEKFREGYEFYMSAGFTQEESRSRAKKESDKIYDIQLKKYKLISPKSPKEIFEKSKI
jgi:hypothetical protein